MYYVVRQSTTDLCKIESSYCQDYKLLPTAQSSILNVPPLGCLAAFALPPLLWETKVYYYTSFALIGLPHVLQVLCFNN